MAAIVTSGATPRREPRRTVALQVRVFGLDAEGKPVNCECSTVDISAHGVRLAGAQHWRPGEVIGIRYGSEKGRFRIVWVGPRGSHAESQIGLQAVEISRHFWGVNMPQFPHVPSTTATPSRIGGVTDATPKPARLNASSTGAPYADKRRHSRLRCNGGAKVILSGVTHWGTVIDISPGGCYVECPSTHPVGTVVYLKLSIEDLNFECDGVVRVFHPGMGMGFEFMRPSSIHRKNLEDFCAELARDPDRLRR